jgi:twitching motility protein PilT
MNLEALLQEAIRRNASDLHLSVGAVPMVRVDGTLTCIDTAPLSLEHLTEYSTLLLPPKGRRLESTTDSDYATDHPLAGRLRVNLYQDRLGPALALRFVPKTLPQLTNMLHFESMQKALSQPSGLLLVTGATGSGKSTTLAAMIHYLNQHKHYHIISLEDPIEFVHTNQKSLIHQREVGLHMPSFQQGLRSALREDPDIILVGELRDLETIRLALHAAATGHLVLASLHANSAAKSIDRLIDSFPGEEKNLISTILAESLTAVFHQVLYPGTEGRRQLIQEIMINTPAIRHLIREHKIAQIEATMETSRHQGMITLSQALKSLSPG